MTQARSMTLKQLQHFVAIAESGSFRKAAERLNTSQPSLTVQISTLEEILDLKLFERSRSGVVLTAAGRELLQRARQVLEESAGFMERAAWLAGSYSGTFRLGVTPTLGPYLLPRVLPTLHSRYEALRLFVRENDPAQLERGLLASDYDLILSTQPIRGGELEVYPLFREPIKLCLPLDHRLARKPIINREDLFGEEVLTMEEHHLYHRQIAELCASIGAKTRRDYEGTSLDTLRQMVVMGMGIAFLPSLYIASEIREHDPLRVESVRGISVQRHHALAWRRRSPSRGLFQDLARAINELVAEHFADNIVSL